MRDSEGTAPETRPDLDIKEALDRVRRDRFLISRVDTWIYEKVMPYLGKRILEVGCGLGNLMERMLDRELVVGIEKDPDTAAHLRERYRGSKNVQVYALDICDPEVLNLKRLQLDSVVSLNVLEHIEDDELALTHMREILQPNGRLIIVVPAHRWLYGTMDRAIAHWRRYSKSSMAAKLDRADFTLLKQEYMNIPGALGWFVSGRLLRRPLPPSGQLKVFNLLVPYIKAVEQVFSPPFGLSLVTIGRAAR